MRWNILAMLVAAGFVAYLQRSNMSVAGELMANDLGFSNIQLGFVFAAFAWAYALFQIPGGVWTDLAGSRRVLTAILVAWAVLTALVGLLPSHKLISAGVILWLIVVLRLLMGVAQAPLFPLTAGAVSRWFPLGGWALPNGMSSTGLTLGAAAASPLVAWLMGIAGWRGSFLLISPVALVLAALWWWYARDEPLEHRGVNGAERALIEHNRPASFDLPLSKGGWKRALLDRDVLLLAVSYFCMNYVFYIFFNWFFIYLIEVRGFARLQGGFAAALPWIVGAVCASFGGWLCDFLCRRMGMRWGCRLPAMVALGLVAVLLVLGANAENATVALVLLALCFGCTQLTEGAYWSATIAVAGRNSAAASGVLNTGGNLVGGFGALLVPLTAARFGWIAALSTGSVFAVVGALLWMFIRADRGFLLTPADALQESRPSRDGDHVL